MALEAYMSSPTDETEKPDDPLAYAPKSVRDSNCERSHETPEGELPQRIEESVPRRDPISDQARAQQAYAPKSARDRERSHETPEGEVPQRNGQSVPRRDPISDQARAQRALGRAEREIQFALRARRPLAKSEEPEDYQMPRFLDRQFVSEPAPAPRALGWLAALSGLVIAASVGAAIALFVSGNLPSELNKMLGLNTTPVAVKPDTTPVGSKPADGILRTKTWEELSSFASAHETSERVPSVRGVTDNEIRLGISAPLTGSAKELGSQMKLGIETAFRLINEVGGIHGRQLRLIAADDGYEPTRTAETMNELYEKQQVFGFIGNVGTPTAVVALPYALERKTLFFGAFTGAGLLRRDPPDRYVFNYRASYAEETYAVVRYLVKVRGLRPDQIAVFAQQDAYGDAGFDGVAKAMRALRGGEDRPILRLDYKRNTVDVDEAVARLRAHKIPIKAIVMVPAYRAAAKFIEKTRDLYPDMIYTNVSFVGSTALADELMILGPRYANGVIVTQVVPAVDSYASSVLTYKTALAKYFPGVQPDYVSLEGYVAGNLLLQGLKRADRQLDTEKLVEALETVRDFDMGLGAPISFGPTEHQGLHKVWGTQLNQYGRYQSVDLE
jgi:ABC-type branched-subunit amino acid transport system substrate-binding protein